MTQQNVVPTPVPEDTTAFVQVEDDAPAFEPTKPQSTTQCEQPEVRIAIGGAAAIAVEKGQTVTLHATDRVPPSGGTLLWEPTTGAERVAAVGPVDGESVTYRGVSSGHVTVRIRHSFSLQQAEATVDVAVVSLAVDPPSALLLVDESADVRATAEPADDKALLVWQQPDPGGVVAMTPENSVAHVRGTRGGATRVPVKLAYRNVTLTRACDVEVVALELTPSERVVLALRHGEELPVELLRAEVAPKSGTIEWGKPSDAVTVSPSSELEANVKAARGGRCTIPVRYEYKGKTVAKEFDVWVVSVQLRPSPLAFALSQGDERKPVALTADVAPEGGKLDWQELHSPVLEYAEAPDGAKVTVLPKEQGSGGTAQVSVHYALGDKTATATADVHVVQVTLDPSPVVVIVKNEPQRKVTATGKPTGGEYAWQPLDDSIADYASNSKGAATIRAQGGGTARVEVHYTAHDQTARATAPVHVMSLTLDPPQTVRALGQDDDTITLSAEVTPVGTGAIRWEDPPSQIAVYDGLATATSKGESRRLKLLAPGKIAVKTSFELESKTVSAWAEVIALSLSLNPSRVVLVPGEQLEVEARVGPDGGSTTWDPPSEGCVAITPIKSNKKKGLVKFVRQGTATATVTYTHFSKSISTTLTAVCVALECPERIVVTRAEGSLQLPFKAYPETGGTVSVQSSSDTSVVAHVDTEALPTVSLLKGGSSIVVLQHVFEGKTASAKATVQVVDVTLGPTPCLIAMQTAQSATVVLTATTSPPKGGKLTWKPSTASHVANYQSAPGGARKATLVGAAGGQTQVSVEFTFEGKTATATLDVTVVEVTVAPSPAIMAIQTGQPAPQVTLIATVTPIGGALTWGNPATAGIVTALPNVTALQQAFRAQVPPGAGGQTTLPVTYAFGTATADTVVTIQVASVSVREGADVYLLQPVPPAAAPAEAIHGDGQPGGGAYTWTALNNPANVAAYAGAPAPPTVAAQQANVVAHGAAAGDQTTVARVRYTLGGQVADATTTLHVKRAACSKPIWGAVPAAQPIEPCPHGHAQGNRQRPNHGGLHPATVPPADYHHHGTGVGTAHVFHNHQHHNRAYAGCYYCNPGGQPGQVDRASGRPVDHWVESGPASAAAQDMVTLYTEITALRALLAGWVPGGPPMPVAAHNYINAHPWLVNVPAWLFDPAGNVGATGKMFGVLRGSVGGQNYRLRAVCGTFPGYGTGNVPNNYWSPQLWAPGFNKNEVPSATQGWFTYPYVPFGAGGACQFGRCAATALLYHALDLGLRIDSMSEMWIGLAMGGRQDGQLQASCDYCRCYFEHLLCDRGTTARVRPFHANGINLLQITNFGF
jgi:hypothetical protein